MVNLPPIQTDRTYSYQEIRTLTGAGTTQGYLLSDGERIVACCLDPRLNPHAPMAYVGFGPIRRSQAKRVCAQANAIPVFLKEGSAAYRYLGDHIAVGYSEDPQHIQDAELKAPHLKGSIAGILRFQPVVRASPA